MSPVVEYAVMLLRSGWIGLLDYLAAHVLLCLVPAFFIAGALSALIPKETITRYLGPRASKWVSYPASAVGGFVLAVCSCTILPLFAGIWKRGAGLGPAITFLFVGPAINILALAYTGAAIGMDIAIARVVLCIVFGIGIGLIMAWLFGDKTGAQEDVGLFSRRAQVNPAVWWLFVLLIGVLVVGTLQVDLLTRAWFSVTLPFDMPAGLLASLDGMHLDLRGAALILMLLLITPAAWLGLRNVMKGFTGWTWASLGLVAVTLLIAAPQVESGGSLVIGFTGRFLGEAVLLAAVVVAARGLERHLLAAWLWETYKFVKQIFPLLVVGVFGAGMVKAIIPEHWIQTLAGRNTIWANLMGVLFGVFMYFPTLVEVPIARMFLDLGMHRGPLLAYLIADPELSLQSILVTSKILGPKRTWVYVGLVTVFSTLAGYIFGMALAVL